MILETGEGEFLSPQPLLALESTQCLHLGLHIGPHVQVSWYNCNVDVSGFSKSLDSCQNNVSRSFAASMSTS